MVPSNERVPLEILDIVWLEDIVEKLHWKHDVEEMEVIEVLENRPQYVWKEAGFIAGEDVYAAFGATHLNRLLSIFFVYTKDKRAIIVSAREMTEKEKKRYAT